jgi:membrane protease YdiL (CAAX protease family)
LTPVFKYIRDFYQHTFHRFYFLLILLLTGTIIYLNYWHALEDRYAAGSQTAWGSFAGFYLLYFVPFAAAFFLQLIFFKPCSYYRNHWFWVILIIAPALFSFRVNFNWQEPIINKIWEGENLLYWTHCINWVIRVFVILVPVYIIWFIKDRSNQPYYGSASLKDIKPYLIMLLIMIPLIALASTQKDFLNMYPKARFLNTLSIGDQKWRYLVYELFYGFDFISIEFFFRGFLILSLLKICGQHCIIPIACFYCCIHLGKPIGEAISSFWGGILLGIVSYNTRSIWGGLIVHLGIAWCMEMGGWLGSLLIS